jgi:hypothetical protein
MPLSTRPWTLFLVFAFLAAPANASALSLESRDEQVTVLELYTSHGCSSCPPADAWLRSLADRPRLWRDFIPLAFHVDYWNNLGWTDRFATSEFSDRQRAYARRGHLSTLYTPGFVLRGKEWQGWFRGRPPMLTPGPAVGKLTLTLQGDSTANIRFSPQKAIAPGRLTVHLVILGFGLATDVGAGENRGRKLEEDFVVLGHRASDLPSSTLEQELPFPKTVPAEPKHRAIAAWISSDTDPTPLQAVAGWLP